MDRKRAIAAGTVLLGIALTLGNMFRDKVASPALAAAEPVAVQPVAPAPEPVAPAKPFAPPLSTAKPAATSTTPLFSDGPAPDRTQVADECLPTLDLVPEPDAMIGVTILAPCNPGERIVLAHEGLTITLASTATGSVFTSIPALVSMGMVTARWTDGTEVTASIDIPEAADVDRFAIQFPASDPLTLNAYAKGAEFGGPGHSRPTALIDLPPGASVAGTVLSLGSADVDLPLLAHVYTYSGRNRPDLTIEAEVTEATCDRELLGETIESRNGRTAVQDLTLMMPPCDAIGEFLILNIAPEDLTLARAE